MKEENDEKAFGAGLIHQAIPDVEGTEPRLTREMLKSAFVGGWDAAKRDGAAAEDEDIADAPDVAFSDWLRDDYDEPKKTDQAREGHGIAVLHETGALAPSVQSTPGESSIEGRTMRTSVHGLPPMGGGDREPTSGLRRIASEHGDAAILQVRMGLADGAYISARAAASYALTALRQEWPTPEQEAEWAARVKPPFKYVPLSPSEKLPDPDYGL